MQIFADILYRLACTLSPSTYPTSRVFQALKAATAQLEETRRGVRAELQGSQAAERRPGIS